MPSDALENHSRLIRAELGEWSRKTLFERMSAITREEPRPMPTRLRNGAAFRERRTFCPEDGHACYTPDQDEPKGWACRNYDLCKSFEKDPRR